MGRLNEKQKMLALGGGAMGLCLLAGGGVYWAKGLIEEERLAIEAKATEIKKADDKIAKVPGTEKEVIILRENLGDYVKILPEIRDINVFVKVLHQFERQSGIKVVEFKPGRPAQGGAERFIRIEYQYEMTATLWQFMKFINFIENFERFVSISNFSLGAGAGGGGRDLETRDGDTVHNIKLTMETYTYNAKGTAQDVQIPEYQDKKDALGEEIFRRLQAIRIDRYNHRGVLGRRDIFIDPRQRVGPMNGVKSTPVVEQKKVIDTHISEVMDLREMFNRARRADITIFEQYGLEKALREGLTRMQDSISRVEEKGIISFQPYRLRWTKEVVDGVDELRKQVETLAEAKGGDTRQRDPYLPKAEMNQLVADMQRMLEMGDLETARNRFEIIQTKLAVPVEDERHALAVRLQALHVKASTAIEFQNLGIKIQGVLVNRDGRSGVVLNGEVYEEGEYVSDELFVKAVREEQVHFVFKGLTLVRTL